MGRVRRISIDVAQLRRLTSSGRDIPKVSRGHGV